MPDEHPSSTELCELLLNTGEPTIWAEMHAALVAIARRHGLIEADATEQAVMPEDPKTAASQALDALSERLERELATITSLESMLDIDPDKSDGTVARLLGSIYTALAGAAQDAKEAAERLDPTT